MPATTEQVNTPSQATTWIKRIACVSFVFFLVKGLIWLGVAAIVGWSVL